MLWQSNWTKLRFWQTWTKLETCLVIEDSSFKDIVSLVLSFYYISIAMSLLGKIFLKMRNPKSKKWDLNFLQSGSKRNFTSLTKNFDQRFGSKFTITGKTWFRKSLALVSLTHLHLRAHNYKAFFENQGSIAF